MTSTARHWPLWIVLAVPALLPFSRLAELPLLVGAVVGIVWLVRRRIDISQPAPRLALLLFAAYWLPQLVSALDAVAPAKAWAEVAADLRFLPFLLFAMQALRDMRHVQWMNIAMAVLVGLWALDALLQAATGFSLGGGDGADRLSGIFGDDNLKLGGVMAALAPFVLLAARRWLGWPALVVVFILLLVVVLLAGARAAWFSYALVAAMVCWHVTGGGRRALLTLTSLGLMATLSGLAAYSLSPRFAERVDRTTVVMEGGQPALDQALSGRITIWQTALSMSLANPLNGVGSRGFRHAYAEHAGPDDPFVDPDDGTGAHHAHQIVLEISSETGGFGLLCWLAGAALALRSWLNADKAQRLLALPASLALLAILFPLNTHYAVYSSFQGLLLFWLLALWIAALHARLARSQEATASTA